MTDYNDLPLRTAALEYAAQGFHVIPCRKQDKIPLVPWKEFQDKPATMELIEAWWNLHPEANIALVLGKQFIAVDVDGPEGHQGLDDVGVIIPPGTPTSMTPRGVHFLFRGESDDRIGLLPKVDIRGKGIIVVPPSIHPTGKKYKWLVPPTQIARAPESLGKLLAQPSSPNPDAPQGPDWVTQAMQGVGEGLRNVTGARLVGYFLSKGMSPETVKVIMYDWADRQLDERGKPLPRYEIDRAIEHIARKEGPHNDDPKTLFEGLLSVGDLYDQAPEQHDWVLQDYIARGGLTMLASEEKVGKSTWTYALMSAVVNGKLFIGKQTKQTPILMLAVEEHKTDVKMRSVRFGLRPTDPVKFHVGDLQSDESTLRELRDVVVQMRAGLVILDTLGHHLANVLETENDNMAVLKAVKPWLHLARETNAAVVIIHHAGKTGAAYRGASAFGGVVDQILTLRHGGGTQRYLESRGRYWETPRDLKIQLVGNDYRIAI